MCGERMRAAGEIAPEIWRSDKASPRLSDSEHVVEEDLVPANPGLKRRVGLAPLGGEHVEVKDLTGEIVPEPLPQETLGRGGRVEFEARRGDKRAHDDLR